MSTLARAIAALGVVVLLSSFAAAQDAAIVTRAKHATALVINKDDSSGTAFCIEPSGWFVTNRHVFGDAPEGTMVTLVINSGEKDEKIVKAKLVRTAKESDLALMQATGSGYESLTLGTDDGLTETQPVTAFGYPFGKALAAENAYPSITVTAGRITAFRKAKGVLQHIQIDNSLNPGNSGGPVINAEGKVIGIVQAGIPGSGLNFAIPVSSLSKIVDKPTVLFAPESIDEAELHKDRKYYAKVISVKPAAADRQVDFELQVGKEAPQKLKGTLDKNNIFSVLAKVIATPKSPNQLKIDADFAEGAVTCRIADADVSVGGETIRLSKIRSLEPGAEGEAPKVVIDGRILRGKLRGLENAAVTLGGAPAKLDFSHVIRMKVQSLETTAPEVTYKIIVREGDKIVAETAGKVAIAGAEAKTTVAAAETSAAGAKEPPPAAPESDVVVATPKLPEGQTIVKLPAPIDRVAVGGHGRYLLLHLQKLQQIAVFDVSEAKVAKYVPLVSNEILFTAGATKFFIGLKDGRQLQRWDLSNQTREVAVPGPEGGIGALAMGAESTSPLFLLASRDAKKSYLVNTSSMKATPFEWPGWDGGAWGPCDVRVSFDGTIATAWGGGWAGCGVVAISGGKVVAKEKSGLGGGGNIEISGDGELFFKAVNGVDTEKNSGPKGIEGVAFAAHDPSFSVAFRQNPPRLTLFGNADPRPLATITDLEELDGDSKLRVAERIHLIPRAHVLVTVGKGSDNLVLRPFDIAKALNDEGLDYLFIESSPQRVAFRGKEYRYAIKVQSRKGSVKYTLSAGPEGMKISNDGVLTWNVPRRYEGDDSPVIVNISDASGQETFQSFRVFVAEQAREVPADGPRSRRP